ncbi:mucin-2 protein [Nocardioides sp. LML1-1-1.1]|uniref:mucin-2 protein n=1 Tax=Nocardioides sp. LML1-1-1.1 TaxID=3135248 RepID=UPI003430768A
MATSHKRETARRTPRAAVLAGSLAVLATGAVVSAGVMSSPAPDRDLLAVDGNRAAGSVQDAAPRELPIISRSSDRSADAIGSKVDRLMASTATAKAVAGADAKRWTTDALNLWTRPDKSGKKVGEVEEGEKVFLTGRTYGGREEIVVGGKARWVTTGHLSDEKPLAIDASCTNGTSVPAGVSPNIKKVHQAVCANFPEVSTYGTFRGDGEHSQGLAVDIMTSGARGWEIAEFVRANYAALGVNYVIYSQKIWSVDRSGEGWRGMSDRGSTTANHYDHVHVTTY